MGVGLNDVIGPPPHTPSSLEFFNDLYHRFLLSPKPSMKSMCLQAMAIVYGQCWEEIGAFNDTKYMVYRLTEVWRGEGGGRGCILSLPGDPSTLPLANEPLRLKRVMIFTGCNDQADERGCIALQLQ